MLQSGFGDKLVFDVSGQSGAITIQQRTSERIEKHLVRTHDAAQNELAINRSRSKRTQAVFIDHTHLTQPLCTSWPQIAQLNDGPPAGRWRMRCGVTAIFRGEVHALTIMDCLKCLALYWTTWSERKRTLTDEQALILRCSRKKTKQVMHLVQLLLIPGIALFLWAPGSLSSPPSNSPASPAASAATTQTADKVVVTAEACSFAPPRSSLGVIGDRDVVDIPSCVRRIDPLPQPRAPKHLNPASA
jgi:hypothetical protein